ncbi:hypothetical protein KYC5002_02760 [Archangium violaceum]|uniref:hypothetical protein n=1 Tax=Archangium violaceum TaxID=83451 RepID=UPI002B28E08A|nr:hypothetical protein KYC5002_02760 [Archangium gephyra]
MVIKSTTDAGLQVLRDIAEPLRKLGDAYSVPLVAQQDGGLPRLFGTGWFFRCEQEWFLVTAEHVRRDLAPPRSPRSAPHDSALLVPGVGGVLVHLSGKWSSSPTYDVAILRLSDPNPIRERWTPVTVADLAPQQDPTGACFYVCGWPLQLCTRTTGALEADKFQFAAKFDAGTERYNPVTEILFPLERNNFGTFDGQPASAPALQGISGAPVWQIFKDDNSRYEPRLAGVETSYLERGMTWYIRATRWPAVRQLIEHAVPGLFKSAERLVGL